MPKAMRSPAEIELVKQKIIEKALSLIQKRGHENFSMRKLAASLNMTAANIYNYYANKEDIHRAIQTEGFSHLNAIFSEIYARNIDSRRKLKHLLLAYLDFGISRKHYYDTLFIPELYADNPWKQTDDQRINLHVFNILQQVLTEINGKKSQMNDEALHLRSLQILSTLHGAVCLVNNKVVQAIYANPSTFNEQLAAEIMVTCIRKSKKEAPARMEQSRLF